jgi:hypothetical protein
MKRRFSSFYRLPSNISEKTGAINGKQKTAVSGQNEQVLN